ncbi:DUF456 domain-containing protein [bacterium]|nr:MAG: DUF456 domain-containing protein [bacterium]RKZ26958.1 MAG: DUF456 domain-containing protein [bacterium]
MILFLSIVLILLGLAGCFLPYIPGPPLVFGGILLYAWKDGFFVITRYQILFLLALTVLSVFLDYFLSMLGAKFKGSKWGVLAAGVGLVVGVFFLPWGVFVFPPLFVFLVEYLRQRKAENAVKSALASFLGMLTGSVLKFLISLYMAVYFLWRVITS